MGYILFFSIILNLFFWGLASYRKHTNKWLTEAAVEAEQDSDHWYKCYIDKNKQYWNVYHQMEELITKLRNAHAILQDIKVNANHEEFVLDLAKSGLKVLN